MPVHHFTTPRVVYLGLAYEAKPERGLRAATGTAPRGPERIPRERVAMRRSERRPRTAVR